MRAVGWRSWCEGVEIECGLHIPVAGLRGPCGLAGLHFADGGAGWVRVQIKEALPPALVSSPALRQAGEAHGRKGGWIGTEYFKACFARGDDFSELTAILRINTNQGVKAAPSTLADGEDR